MDAPISDERLLTLTCCYIAHGMMMLQVAKIEDIYRLSCQRFPALKEKKEIFTEALQILNQMAVITSVTDKYIYQTTSNLEDHYPPATIKSTNEIMQIAGVR
jgi:hypothetical protein